MTVQAMERKVHGNARLNWDQAKAIRDLYDLGFTIRALAKSFGLCPTAIYAIVTNKTWHDPNYTPKKGSACPTRKARTREIEP